MLSSFLVEELKKLKAADDEEETLQQVQILRYVYAKGFTLYNKGIVFFPN